MSTGQRFWRGFLVTISYLVAYVGMILGLGLLIDVRANPLLLISLTLGLMIVLGIVFAWHLHRLINPPLLRETRTNGLAATGRVLQITMTHAKKVRSSGWATRETSREYCLELEISPSDGASYQATLYALKGIDVV